MQVRRGGTAGGWRPWLLAALMGLAGCATPPADIRDAPAHGPGPAAVRAAPEQFKGQRVRWGGLIVAIHNEADLTEVELVSRPLDDSGRPERGDASEGRFLARIQGFVDPAIYAQGRELTVVGEVQRVEQRAIGEHGYRYPVVQVTSHHLWPQRSNHPPPAYYDPFYDPWPYYDPWFPYGPLHRPWY